MPVRLLALVFVTSLFNIGTVFKLKRDIIEKALAIFQLSVVGLPVIGGVNVSDRSGSIIMSNAGTASSTLLGLVINKCVPGIYPAPI